MAKTDLNQFAKPALASFSAYNGEKVKKSIK